MNSHLIIHCPTSEGVSEVSEQAIELAQQSMQAKRVVRSEPTCERTSKWPSAAAWILGYSGPQCPLPLPLPSPSRCDVEKGIGNLIWHEATVIQNQNRSPIPQWVATV